MEKPMLFAAFGGMFNVTLFAQEMTSVSNNMPAWERLGVAGLLAFVTTAAAIYCFRAYKKSVEERIADLKYMLEESEKSRNELKTILDQLSRNNQRNIIS